MKKILALSLVLFVFLISGTVATASSRVWHVRLTTNKGEIVVRLYDQTPLHRDNFVKLTKEGYFNGILFHRVINDFMIQSGDPDSKERVAGKLYGNGGPKKNIPAEFIPELFHKRGALAAAREGDASNPFRESSGSQFYIVEGKIQSEELLSGAEKKINDRNRALGNEGKYIYPENVRDYYKKFGGTPHLDTQYTVFGEVVSGMDVVFTISDVKTDSNDRPIDDIFIISAKAFKKRVSK